MKQTTNRGFTLIELLVVIAIIGILASVVLASLNSARDKGADAAAKASMNNIRSAAEVIYDDANPDSYDAVCTAGSAVMTLGAAADAQNPAAATFDCDDSGIAYAAEVVLRSGSYFCIDSTGAVTETGGSKGAAATACP